MLVLSRRLNEKVLFPNLGITIQIIRVAGKAVRIGIDAPPDIPVLREEVADSGRASDIPPVLSRQVRHQLRNRLNTASLGLQVLHRRLEVGEIDDAEPTIFKIFNELQEIDAELRPQDDHQEERKTGRCRRALIVEDNSNESELLAAYLRLNGYEVETVNDGLKALAYLKENEQPDAVLLDMCMPRLDGRKTVTSIRCEPKWRDLKLYAVSGANRQDMGVDIGPRGVDRWFSKPVDASQLVREINRELDEELLSA